LSNAEKELQEYAELKNTCNYATIENTTLSSLLKTKTADLLNFKDANAICLRNNEIFRTANNQLAQTNSLLQNKVNILEHLNPSDRKVGIQDCSDFFYESWNKASIYVIADESVINDKFDLRLSFNKKTMELLL
jgi:hypothetical protein